MSLDPKYHVANTPEQAAERALAEVRKAVAKFPTWPTDPLHALPILGEEFGELTKATLQLTYEPGKVNFGDMEIEAIQTAAMAIRFLQSLHAYRFHRGHQHRQPLSDSSGLPSSTSSPATGELDKPALLSEPDARDFRSPAFMGCGEWEKGASLPLTQGERQDIHPGSARPLNDCQPDGWAVVASDGHFVGIWQARDIADKVVNRSPSVKGERVVGMIFAK